MTITRSRALIIVVASIAVAWSLVFSAGLTAPTGSATMRGSIHASTGTLIPGALVSLPSTSAKPAGQNLNRRQGLSNLPAAAQPVVSATLGENDGRYQVGAAAGVLRAQNPAQALQADFTRQGMELHSGQSHWRLALGGYGYGDHLETVGEAVPQSRANRVEYLRGPLVEWYVNGPAGVEQGFTISAPPALGTRYTGHGTRNSSPLTIALEIGGDLTATADSSAEGVGRAEGLTLRDGHGQAVLRYTGLTAHDASGRALVAWLEVERQELRLRVDDAGARYPVVVDPFIQQALLTSSDGAPGDSLGYAMGFSSDGTTIVAGAPVATIGSNSNQGAAYVFVMPASGWETTSTFTAKLTASDGASGDQLGTSAGISSNGGVIVLGAPHAMIGSNAGQGAAYVFVMPGGGWGNMTQTAKLTASNGASGDGLGTSAGVSSDGMTIVTGAPYATIGSNSGQGAAYVFVRAGSAWATTSTFTAELTASDGASGDALGTSLGVSTNGLTVVAGAPNATLGANTLQGAAYVFVRPGSGWATTSTFTAKLTASDGASGDHLGVSAAIGSNGTTIVAGAPDATIDLQSNQGAAYVFVMPGTGWVSATQTAKLTASDGDGFSYFGRSVSVNSTGGTVVAGAPLATVTNFDQGAAYVFVMPVSGWATTSTFTAKLAAAHGPTTAYFASSLGVSGDGKAIAAGAYGLNSSQGAVSVILTIPTVTFTGAPASEPYGATFTVPDAATNTSIAPVYTSNDACSNVGTQYTMTSGTGACYEIATWPANVDYASAKVVQRTTASKIAPTVTFTDAPPSEVYQGTFTVASSTNSSTSPVYTASGSCTNVGPLYTMTKGTGTCTSKVSWASDSNYDKASLTQTTTAFPIGQTITFTTPAPATAADHSTFMVAADSSSGLTVAFSVDAVSTGVCKLGTRTVAGGVSSAPVTMLKGSGTCTIDANQAGNGNYSGAPQQQTSAAATP